MIERIGWFIVTVVFLALVCYHLGLMVADWSVHAAGPYAVVCQNDEDTSVGCAQRRLLELRQKDAIIAEQQWKQALSDRDAAYAALDAEAEKIKTANGWPKDLLFDRKALTFIEAPKKP